MDTNVLSQRDADLEKKLLVIKKIKKQYIQKDKKKKNPHKIVIHSCSNYRVKTEIYGKGNADSIPLRL